MRRLEGKIGQLTNKISVAETKILPLIARLETGISSSYWRGVLAKDEEYKQRTAKERGVTPDKIITKRDNDETSQEMKTRFEKIDGLNAQLKKIKDNLKAQISAYSVELAETERSMLEEVAGKRSYFENRRKEAGVHVQELYREKARLEGEYASRMSDIDGRIPVIENEIRSRTEELYERQEATELIKSLISKKRNTGKPTTS